MMHVNNPLKILVLTMLTGCVPAPQPVDLFAEFMNHAPFGTPTCPEIRTKNNTLLNLRDVQVFKGSQWEIIELDKVSVENDKARATLWAPTEKVDAYWMVRCSYYGMDEAVEINLPRSTRYCVSILSKIPPASQENPFVFWCVPSPIQE